MVPVVAPVALNFRYCIIGFKRIQKRQSALRLAVFFICVGSTGAVSPELCTQRANNLLWHRASIEWLVEVIQASEASCCPVFGKKDTMLRIHNMAAMQRAERHMENKREVSPCFPLKKPNTYAKLNRSADIACNRAVERKNQRKEFADWKIKSWVKT